MQDAKAFLIDLLYKNDHGATIGELEKLVSERDEAIRNKPVRLKEHVPNPLEFLDDFGKGG